MSQHDLGIPVDAQRSYAVCVSNAPLDRDLTLYQVPEKPLFKYLSLAAGQKSLDRLRALVIDGKAFFSSPADFNDPFDTFPIIEGPKSRVKAELSVRRAFRRADRLLPPEQRAYAKAASKRPLTRGSLATFQTGMADSARRTAIETGVFCLSERNDSVLMWGHYADSHQGVCIEFDINAVGLTPSALTPLHLLFKVKYQSERPVIRHLFGPGAGEEVMDAFRTKAAFWEYEQEWRAIEMHGARQLFDFRPSMVRSIILGANCSPSHTNAIREMVGGTSIKLTRVVPSAEDFGLSIVSEPTA